jgi:hypothetical protein
MHAITTMYGSAAAFGSIKTEDFRRFLEQFGPMEPSQTLDQLKQKGLPIEDK